MKQKIKKTNANGLHRRARVKTPRQITYSLSIDVKTLRQAVLLLFFFREKANVDHESAVNELNEKNASDVKYYEKQLEMVCVISLLLRSYCTGMQRVVTNTTFY